MLLATSEWRLTCFVILRNFDFELKSLEFWSWHSVRNRIKAPRFVELTAKMEKYSRPRSFEMVPSTLPIRHGQLDRANDTSINGNTFNAMQRTVIYSCFSIIITNQNTTNKHIHVSTVDDCAGALSNKQKTATDDEPAKKLLRFFHFFFVISLQFCLKVWWLELVFIGNSHLQKPMETEKEDGKIVKLNWWSSIRSFGGPEHSTARSVAKQCICTLLAT